MRDAYLEVTYRHGKPFAAYYHLARASDHAVHHTRARDHGLVIDYAVDDQPIGIEITSPTEVTLAAFNTVLRELGQQPIAQRDFAPLDAA